MLLKDLRISDFESLAFKYDIVELNTSVKPTFLKMLLGRGVDQLIYFDPDILICASVDFIFEALTSNAIVLTPHCILPNEESPDGEAILLYSGIFNLGFIAVSRTEESERFLSWWEHRCLTLGYTERRNGLYVDQKWINLVPCYFDSVYILKHPGCNIAYWNLHERSLIKAQDSWVVNGKVPLVFFHFSGISVDGGKIIAKKFDQFDLASRPDLAELFASYREDLIRHGIRSFGRYSYGFGHYSNGQLINRLQRALYAARLDEFSGSDPFYANGPFYEWARKKHLMSSQDTAGKHNKKSYDKKDVKVRLVNAAFRLALRLLGADRYTVLLKYLEYISVLRNQGDVICDS
ncbi:MAG: group 1 glycosyl transferase [Terracidiphilus sp.]|nr:group 1 glycosyl transferase [Terracidiphilus sp.]